MEEKIRTVLSEYGRLTVDARSVRDQDDLFSLGMTSFANVNVMLGLEQAFGIQFPGTMLKKTNFRTMSSIRSSVNQLLTTG